MALRAVPSLAASKRDCPINVSSAICAFAYTIAMLPDLASKRVTVMGLGQFGGGTGVTRWLAAQGADVLVTDLQNADTLQASITELQPLIDSGAVTLRLGEHNVSDFTTCDLVIANPAVPKPWENRFLRSASAAGTPITTEIRLLVERLNRQRVIGVTGSAGKSTTTAMVHHLLRKAGVRSHLGGNIGGSLLLQLDQIAPDDWIALELSSAMLYWLGNGVGNPAATGWSPHIAVVTNISPNHIDWHGTFEHYKQSKQNILAYQTADDFRITAESINLDASLEISLKIPGRHNLRNAHMAILAVHRAIGIAPRDAAALLADFSGLPHRLQLVSERGHMRFYNDSKSTTPEATVLAVEAFEDPAKIHLIAGGYDKGSNLTPIARLSNRIAGLYTIGATGSTLAANANAHACGFARYCETLDAAAALALQRMKPGDILLLSPGCASWDQFTNFEQRGERFIQLITQYSHAPTMNA